MKNFISLLSLGFFIAGCASKQPVGFSEPFPSPEAQAAVRDPSGLFDFLKGKKKEEGLLLTKCDNCVIPSEEDEIKGEVRLESEKSCSQDRLYYQDEFRLAPESYKSKRENFTEAQVPPACVAYIMRTFDAYKLKTKALTQCTMKEVRVKDEESGQEIVKPQLVMDRGFKSACVTPEYFYSTYNAYVDVMDCLDIPQRELMPKLWNESYFQMNMSNPKGNDAGVGQLTDAAISDVVKPKYADMDIREIEFYKKEMSKSDKASCKRIVADASAWKVITPKVEDRCELMHPPDSPLRNILYTGIFYRVITERIAGLYYRAGREVLRTGEGWVARDEKANLPLAGDIKKFEFKEKLEQVGIQNPDMNYLKQVLVTLAFNAGTKSSSATLDAFLKARIANNMKVEMRELDFINADSSAEIALVNEPENETEEAKAKRVEALQKARETAHERGLPQFMRLMQPVGSPGYVSKVAYRNKKLNNEIGDGVCTEPSFLQPVSRSSSESQSSPTPPSHEGTRNP